MTLLRRAQQGLRLLGLAVGEQGAAEPREQRRRLGCCLGRARKLFKQPMVISRSRIAERASPGVVIRQIDHGAEALAVVRWRPIKPIVKEYQQYFVDARAANHCGRIPWRSI